MNYDPLADFALDFLIHDEALQGYQNKVDDFEVEAILSESEWHQAATESFSQVVPLSSPSLAKESSLLDFSKHSTLGSRWTEQEEIILIGVVTDLNLLHWSHPSWPCLHRCYKHAVRNYNSIHNSSFSDRTVCACRKHLKEMYRRVETGEVPSNFWYEVYHRTWLSDAFNGGGKLLNSQSNQFKQIIHC